MSILVVMEQRGGAWNRMSWETLAAAQQMAGELGTTASAAVLGQGIEALGGELAAICQQFVQQQDHWTVVEVGIVRGSGVVGHSRVGANGKSGCPRG